MEVRELIENYLEKSRLMQVATANNNQPWACTVYFAYDEKLQLFWISKTSGRHSEELRNNEKVAGTIVLSHTLGDKVRGIQFQGIAKELTNETQARVGMKYYAGRYGMEQKRVDAIIKNRDGHVCYRITPKLYVLFDEVNFPDNPRQEMQL